MREGQKRIVFLAHWVEPWNWLLWWSRDLHSNPQNHWKWIWVWPFCAVMSVIYLVGRKAYDEVDRFAFGTHWVHTWLVRNFAWHFLLKNWQERIRGRIIQAVLAAQDHKIDVVGLGALTKAEWLTAGGAWIVEHLGDRLHTPIVHGDTLTAAAIFHRALELIKNYELIGPVFVTGATSKIGRAVILALVKRGLPVRMLTESQERFEQIRNEAGKDSRLITRATNLSAGHACGFWITGKAQPNGKKLLKYLPHGAVVLNFSVPDPLSERDLRRAAHIRHFDGGLMGYDPEKVKVNFTMRLTPGLTYACHAGTIVHALAGWREHEVGAVDMSVLPVVWRKALEAGFFLPPFTSYLKEISAPSGKITSSGAELKLIG